MCEKLRATRQCSSIKDIFAPIHSQALSGGLIPVTLEGPEKSDKKVWQNHSAQEKSFCARVVMAGFKQG
jgi:hypothetical protein